VITRRRLLGVAAAAALPMPALAKRAMAAVVVVGGGFAGASCARWLRRLGGTGIRVALVEPNPVYTACPMSNAVLAGERGLDQQHFAYDALMEDGIEIRTTSVTAVDAERRLVRLADDSAIHYQRLVLAPGVDFRWDALPGYGKDAVTAMPHAWKAGDQTLLLKSQLEAMEDGGLVVISAPANPFRCPPGPYERASLIAHYLKRAKPNSKLMILDAKDAFSKQKLFQAAWQQLYPGMIEWVPLSQGGKVISVDPKTLTLTTDFTSVRAAVANVIPPQKAGEIARIAGVADATGWCPIDPVSCESKSVPDIHVIGDAAIAGAMPKSAFAANAQAKICAAALVSLLQGNQPAQPLLINTCYSLVAPDYGISIAGVYHAEAGLWTEVKGSGGISPLAAPSEQRAQEARLANGWFNTITADVFG
jgi:NADPH-dependent 2,4-dienoyl-CoA reductase/sulfur reductase-like enzyme